MPFTITCRRPLGASAVEAMGSCGEVGHGAANGPGIERRRIEHHDVGGTADREVAAAGETEEVGELVR